MNPRDFLREPGYPLALLTTYSFDPYFFERLVLPDLWAGGSNSVLVLVDQGELRNALNSHLENLRHLGRRYFLQPVEWRGAFHPKIFLRLGDEGGLIWVGSNNLTRGGWGGNSELGSAWRLDRDGLDGCGWLTGLISYLDSTTTGLAKDLVYKALRLPWLEDIPGESRHDVLISLEEPIGVQVGRRWAGRRFTSLKVLTGSTDRDAGFLHWASETFGLEDIDICLTPECASLEAPALGGLGPKVRIVPPLGQKLMHAKFYWFNGPDGPGALWGSANCSSSAWLIPGQNLEAMVVEDAPEPIHYSDILQVFEQEEVDPSVVLIPRPQAGSDGEQRNPPLRIVAASAEANGRVQVEVKPPIQPGAAVLLEIGSARLCLEGAGSQWAGDLSNAADDSHVTMVRVVVEGPGSQELWSDVRWIDRLSELREVLSGTDFRATMGAMLRFESHAADQRLAHELGRIGMAILTDSSSYPDVSAFTRGPSGTKKRKDERRPPLDPEALLVSLRDVGLDSIIRTRGTVGDYGISGVFRALFAQMDDENAETKVKDEVGEGSDPDPFGQSRTVVTKDPPVDVNVKASEVLQKHMERFLSIYKAREFATACTATQLAQATAYPIAVAVMGERRGWCTNEQRRSWVSRTVQALLKDDRFNQREALLTSVGRRYADGGHNEAFDREIGDGRLWLALLVAWDLLPGATTEERLQQVTLFRDFVSRRELLESTEESRLIGLFRAYSMPDAIEAACSRAMRLGRATRDLECSLGRSYEQVLRAQSSMELEYQAGELVWSPKGGWGITKEDQQGQNVDVYVAKGDDVRTFLAQGWFVNVSRLSEVPGVPAELVAEVAGFLHVLKNVDRGRVRDGTIP